MTHHYCAKQKANKKMEEQIRRKPSATKLPSGWDKYDRDMDAGVPALTEHYVERGASAAGSFVDGIANQLLAGALAIILHR